MKQTKRISSYGLITSQNHILLSLLNRGPNKGKYNLPGGGVEFGEDPSAAFIREVEEEAGYKVVNNSFKLHTVISELHRWQTDNLQQEELHLIGIIYKLEAASMFQCKLGGDGDSSGGCQWFMIKDINENIITTMARKALRSLNL